MSGNRMKLNAWSSILFTVFILVFFSSTTYAQGTLSVNPSGKGTGVIKSSDNLINCGADCSETYQNNKTTTLKATAGENSYFAGWSGDACNGLTKSTCTVTTETSKTVTATFEQDPSLVLSKSGDGRGSVKSAPPGIDCGADCQEGTAQFDFKKKVTLTAKPDANSTFLGWSGDSCNGVTKTQCTVLMDASKDVTAAFGYPGILISPTSYDFGDVKLKQTSPAAAFTITNQGAGGLILKKVELTGMDKTVFKMKASGSKKIVSGGQFPISVTFVPTSAGSKSAMIRITSNHPTEPVIEIALTGRGTDSILTGSNTPMAASAVIQTYNLFNLTNNMISSLPIGSLSVADVTGQSGLGTFGSVVISPSSFSCDEGGSFNISLSWSGSLPDDPSQIVDFNMKINFNNCTQLDGSYLDGKFDLKFEGPLGASTGMIFSIPGLTYTNSGTGDAVSINSFNLTLTGFNPDEVMGELSAGSMTVTGTVSGTIEDIPIDTEFDHYEITFDASSETGTEISIAGRMKTLCLGDWITITTNTPIFISAGEYCPASGEVVMTSGEYDARVTITDSIVEVYYNDVLIETYDSCEGVIGLCGL